MDEPPKNQRIQFSLRALLLYTFAVAVWISFFTSNSFAAMFTAWLLMLLFLLYYRNGWCLFIHGMGLLETCLIGIGGISYHQELFYVGLKISGIISFATYNYCLWLKIIDPSNYSHENSVWLVGKCPSCCTRIRAENTRASVCPRCGERVKLSPKLFAGDELLVVTIVILIAIFIYLLFPVIY